MPAGQPRDDFLLAVDDRRRRIRLGHLELHDPRAVRMRSPGSVHKVDDVAHVAQPVLRKVRMKREPVCRRALGLVGIAKRPVELLNQLRDIDKQVGLRHRPVIRNRVNLSGLLGHKEPIRAGSIRQHGRVFEAHVRKGHLGPKRQRRLGPPAHV